MNYNFFMDEIKELQTLINNAKKIVFFGGAGVSTESGIPDFRSEKGLYKLKSKYGVPYETILSHDYYENNTLTFFKFYREFMINTTAQPNQAHKYLAKLEKRKDLWIITQNIDGLHQLAGSKNVIELHGSIHRNYCEKCMKLYSLDEILNKDIIPKCDKCGGIIKPDVVLYEEALNDFTVMQAINYIKQADVLIVAGTSLTVYPASGLIRYFRGKHLVIINRDTTDYDNMAELVIHEKLGDVFGKLKIN